MTQVLSPRLFILARLAKSPEPLTSQELALGPAYECLGENPPWIQMLSMQQVYSYTGNLAHSGLIEREGRKHWVITKTGIELLEKLGHLKPVDSKALLRELRYGKAE